MLHGWRKMNEWLKAFLLALALLIATHVLVFRWVTVESTSMYATLLPGDLLLVQRWPIWTGFDRGDIAVFRDPLKDRVNMIKRPLLVKRIMGMPGDVVQLRDGDLFVNDIYIPPRQHGTSAWLVRFDEDASIDEALRSIGMPQNLVSPGRSMLELPLNDDLAKELERSGSVVNASEMSAATGAPRHIFPFSEYFKWNSDSYGPITVPAKGDTIAITPQNLPLYDRLISIYEGKRLSVSRDSVMLGGTALTSYIVEQNYYFMLGDSRHHSADSRFWGFVPQDHLVGRGAVVILSKDENGLRSGRTFLGL